MEETGYCAAARQAWRSALRQTVRQMWACDTTMCPPGRVNRSIGGRTAVANNEQITEAIAAAVYNAVVSAQAQQADRPIQINETINLDGRAVYRNQRQVERAQGYRMTTSTIPV